jgi:predicted O-methyltransferase YrrM
MIVADNAISHAQELREFLDFLERDPQAETILVPVGTGLRLAMKVQ